MTRLRQAFALGLSALALGFLLGRWAIPAPAPATFTLGSNTPQPGRDLSPAGAPPGAVVMPRIQPGRPKAPPVALEPPGKLLNTTAAPIPALPLGGTFYASTYATPAPHGLRLRSVLWLESPGGLMPLGDTVTTEQAQTFEHQAPAPAHWALSVLAGPRPAPERVAWGALVQYSSGPVVFGAGWVDRQAFAACGLRW